MELEIIKHSDLLFKDLLRVIRVKSMAWPYPFGSQVEWIANNISNSDLHVFLRDGDVDVAYLNLVETTFVVNDTEYLAYGVGNVCSTNKGKGFGRELLLQVNDYLKHTLHAGLLFCRKTLLSFYGKFGWEEVVREKCDVGSLPNDVHVMTYLIPEPISTFSYKGRFF